LRVKKGIEPLAATSTMPALEQRRRDFDKLAAVVRGSLDMGKIYRLLGLEEHGGER
jgi:adenosylcobyric acid synthase